MDLPATAMLLVALHEKPSFELPTERTPAWYGWSADTAERGLRALEDVGLITKTTRVKKAPLSPTGQTRVNIYTLKPPFAPSKAHSAIAEPARKRSPTGRLRVPRKTTPR